MVHGSCGEGRQKPNAGQRQEKAFLVTRAKKGACSRARTDGVPAPAGQGCAEENVMGAVG